MIDDCAILVSTFVSHDGVRCFKCKIEAENKTYQLLLKKLKESSWIPLPIEDKSIIWIFSNAIDEESFMESFRWMIIYEYGVN